MSSDGDRRELLERQDIWMAAVRDDAMELLEEILGEEFTLISARLGFVSRQGWLEMVPRYELRDFRFEDPDVRIYGDTAVVNSRYRQSASLDGQDLSVPFYLTDVWVRRDGRWRVVTRHSSIAAPTPAQPGA